MSRLNSLSASAIKAMFSSETDEQLITLLTIKDPDGGTDDVRLADSFIGRLFPDYRTRASNRWSKSGSNTNTDRNWGLYRSWYASNPSLNWGDGATGEISGTITLANGGNNVDIIISEAEDLDPNHPEFALNADGTGGSRVQYFNWYSLAATVGDTANIGNTYSTTVSNINNLQHAHHVAGIAAGNTQGWATKANIYSISRGTAGGGITYTNIFKYIKAWHLAKTNTKPTIVNNSWNTENTYSIASIQSVNYRGQTYVSPFTTSQLENYGLFSKDGTNVRIPQRNTAVENDIQDCIDAGVVIVFCAMNNSMKITTDPNDPDYNNTVTIGGNTLYYNRGGVGAASDVILVGGIRAAVNLVGSDGIANFSNRGPRVDLFAPGAYVMSSLKTADPPVSTTSGYIFPTPVADPRNSNYYLGKASGTSMAAPQVTGLLALLANNYQGTFNQTIARDLLFNNATTLNQIPSSSGGITDVYDLLGAANRYLSVPSTLTNISNTLNWSTQELETLEGYTDDTEVMYGVTFAGKDYWFIPMQINLPSEEETGVGNLTITINYVTPEAITLIRKYLTKPTQVTISLVLSSNLVGPAPEAEFSKFYIVGATYSAESIQLQLEMINFTREPFPSFTFSPLYFPGLF
jgi:hypothetical protein